MADLPAKLQRNPSVQALVQRVKNGNRRNRELKDQADLAVTPLAIGVSGFAGGAIDGAIRTYGGEKADMLSALAAVAAFGGGAMTGKQEAVIVAIGIAARLVSDKTHQALVKQRDAGPVTVATQAEQAA